MSTTTYIIIMAVCLLLSAYFSATETAFSSANSTRLKTLAEKGNKNAALACRLLGQYDKLLSTILIGWVKSPQYVIGEMERNGETFRRRGVYTIMIRFIAPVMMFVLFLQSTGILS